MANTLVHDIEHHAKDKADLVYILGVLFATELNPKGWQARQARNGNNSWLIYLRQDGKPTKIWHFTGYHKGAITVRNNYYWARANRKFTMKTRVDAIRFVRQIVNG